MATLVEGHDPMIAYRVWKRIETRLSFDDRINIQSQNELVEECERLEKAFRADPSSTLESISSIGRVTAEAKCHLVGKEIQEAKWLASLGYDVRFRDPNSHKNTSDALVDGQTWDFKRIISANPNKIAQHIRRKKKQGPNYLIDLVFSEIPEEVALCKIASLLEDEDVLSVMLVTKNHVSLLSK